MVFKRGVTDPLKESTTRADDQLIGTIPASEDVSDEGLDRIQVEITKPVFTATSTLW